MAGGFAKALAFAKPSVGGQSRRAVLHRKAAGHWKESPCASALCLGAGFPSNLLIQAINVGHYAATN